MSTEGILSNNNLQFVYSSDSVTISPTTGVSNSLSLFGNSNAPVSVKNMNNISINSISPTSTNISINPSSYSMSPSTNGAFLNISSQTLTDNSNHSVTSVATFVSIQRPTLSSTTPVITSTATTLYVAGDPIAGTNQTIIEPYALRVAQGDSTFAGRVLATGNIVGSSQITGSTLTDGTSTMTGGILTTSRGIAQALMRLSYIPTDMVLFTGASGDISFTSNFKWNGSLLTASLFETQNITRPNDPNTASLWSDGTGSIDIGLQSTGTIQLGLGPTLKLTQNSSTLKSELTIQSNFSRQYTISTITSAANVTYTAAQCFGGLIARNPNGANRTDTFPTAAQLVSIVPDAVVGSSIEVLIRNTTTGLFLITLAAGTGVTILGTATVAPGLTNRILIIFTNVSSGTEAVTVFLAVPKDRITLQGSFTNPTSGAATVTWMNWGPTVASTVVDSIVLGYSGIITQLVCAYSNTAANPIGIDAGESLSFSIGTSNSTLTTFTAYSGGTNVVVFSSTDNGTFPRKSSGALLIAVASTDRLSVQSTEVGSVNPTSGNAIRCVLTIELD